MAERARLVLASASPRRVALLSALGTQFDVVPADIDETEFPGESAAAMVQRLAEEKAAHVAVTESDAFVIGGDTTVYRAGQILAKPEGDADARRMLSFLSGSDHHVFTGIAVMSPSGAMYSSVETSTVWMRELSDADIDWYLGTGEHVGKAGAYAIQGAASVFVDRIDGDHNAIVGLPVAGLDRLFGRFERSLRDFS